MSLEYFRPLNKKYMYLLACFFALISSLRLPFIPEMQLLFLLVILCFDKDNERPLLVYLAIVCTHTYAIPDAILRLTPQDYPSIYTRAYGPIKILDLLVIAIFIYNLGRVRLLFSLKNISILFFILVVVVTATLVNNVYGHSQPLFLFFHIRNFLIAITVALWLTKVKTEHLNQIFVFCMWCWILKMIFVILFPSSHIIQRSILGIDWFVFFAGDEYLSFGTIAACGLYVARKASFGVGGYQRKYSFLCLIALVLALISQRKGAIPYFLIVFALIYACHETRRYLWRPFFAGLFIFRSYMFFFFLFFYPLLSEDVRLVFLEYKTLNNSAMESIEFLLQSDPLSFLFGLGASGLYEIKALPEYADHFFSFGSEVGETYRYTVWTLPFGRLFLNIGIVGSILVLIHVLIDFFKGVSPEKGYISLGLVPLFALYGLTPVSAIFIGFALNVYAWRKY